MKIFSEDCFSKSKMALKEISRMLDDLESVYYSLCDPLEDWENSSWEIEEPENCPYRKLRPFDLPLPQTSSGEDS